jgi:hypothetical protein
MGRSWLDSDYPVDCQELSSIQFEVLVVLVVKQEFVLAEVVRTVVVDHADIQVGVVAAAAAAAKNENILVETVSVVAAVGWSKHHQSIAHTSFAERGKFVQDIVADMPVLHQYWLDVNPKEEPSEPWRCFHF